MADEFQITTQMVYQSGEDYKKESDRYSVTQVVGPLGGGPGVQVITTTHLAVNDSVTNLGVAYFKNLDSTNFIELGVDVSSTFYPVLRLGPGESVVCKLSPAITLYAKADTAVARLQAAIYEQ